MIFQDELLEIIKEDNDLSPAEKRSRYNLTVRIAVGAFCGMLAGALMAISIQTGLGFAFKAEKPTETWGLLLWGEHWAWRSVASWTASLWGGYIAGLIARRRGVLASALGMLPSNLIWLIFAYCGWAGRSLPHLRELVSELSIGNKLMATLLAISTMIPATIGGESGEHLGSALGPYFDTRRGTLLGIKWFHYLWIPLVMHLNIMQASWATLYGFEWLKELRMSPVAMVPSIFCMAIWATLYLQWYGAERTYTILAELENIPPNTSRCLAILKYAVGVPLLAAAAQSIVSLIQMGLSHLFAK